MLCVVISGPFYQDAIQQISEAQTYADLVELRLDCFRHLDLSALQTLRSHFSIPMIFTLRSQGQGGNYKQSEQHRLNDIRRLATLKPEYLDIEHDVSLSFIEEISHYSDIKLILSYHNFEETPQNLEEIYQDMRKTFVSFYKIAVTAKNSLDAMRLICWAKQSYGELIAISMGLDGQISRILSPMIGCPITYTTLEEKPNTLGQLSAKTLIEQYNYASLSPHTRIYGLIGDPVDQSISHVTHNHLIHVSNLDAVYVKIRVKPAELVDFLNYARELPFHGLSVTSPLKENILASLDEVDPQALEMGAVNTLLLEKDKIIGFNTDGSGALNVIEQECPLKGKKIVIIGAGGAARAIAYEAVRRGGLVTIINRDVNRALQLAHQLNCKGNGLEHIAICAEAGYDILINATSAPLPISPDYILPQALVMDIMSKPKETPFLKHASEKNCHIIYGYMMFVEQALGQFDLWFKDCINIQRSRKTLENRAIKYLL